MNYALDEEIRRRQEEELLARQQEEARLLAQQQQAIPMREFIQQSQMPQPGGVDNYVVPPPDELLNRRNMNLREQLAGTPTTGEWTRDTASGRPQLRMQGAPRPEPVPQAEPNLQKQLLQGRIGELMQTMTDPSRADASRSELFKLLKEDAISQRQGETDKRQTRLDEATIAERNAQTNKLNRGEVTKSEDERRLDMYNSMPEGDMKRAYGIKSGFVRTTKDDGPGEDERKVSYHVGSILQGLKNIQGQVAMDASATSPGMMEAAASAATGEYGGTANSMRSAPRQIAHSTTAGVLDSLLYLATGAAYNKEQLDAKRAELTPAYTDKPETVAYKRRRISEYIESAKQRTGRAWTPEMTDGFNQLFGVAGQEGSLANQVPGQAPTANFSPLTPAEQNRLAELKAKYGR